MKKMTKLIFIFLLATFSLNAQINGKITDNHQMGLAGATISLLSSKDSLVKLSLSGEKGDFSFQNIKQGRYRLRIVNLGYANSLTPFFDYIGKDNFTVPVPGLAPVAKLLQDVVVTSQKPMIEVKADKTIINIEGTINATGTDALDLLRKSPGVLLDKDDNISMNGKNGIQIYIDGRQSPLGGKDLSEYLKTLQSSMIESIEIITNPSAKYDAAGNAGIINIKLKKNKAFGTNGNVNVGYNFGITPKYNGGLSLNHRNKRINIFTNYNIFSPTQENRVYIKRTLLDSLFDQTQRETITVLSQSYKAGMDYFISKKSTLGILINGSHTNGDAKMISKTPISYVPTNTIIKNLSAESDNFLVRNNINTNINYKYIDTSGRELNVDADYGKFRISTDQYQPNYYYDASGTIETSRVIYQMMAPTNIDIYAFRTDFEAPFKKGKIGIGGKLSSVMSNNDFQRFNVFSTGKIKDSIKSNLFNYKENINALYLSYNRQMKGWLIQFGIRMENTHSSGYSAGFKQSTSGYTAYDSTFERSYTGFFPNAAITFNKNTKSQWNLTYSRRIDRPVYQNLNPFEFKLDEYTYQKGNTELTPQYTNSFGISNTFKYKLNTSLTYSHVKDVFTRIIDTAEKSKVFVTPKNLATQDIISLNISYPIQIKWYNAFINLNSYYSHFKANLGVGRIVDLEVFAINYSMQNSAKLGKGWTGELNGFYGSPTIQQGTFRLNGLWSMDIGVQKIILKNKGTVRVSVSDIFHTLNPTINSIFAGQTFNQKQIGDTRLLKLSFAYRFGSTQVKFSRQRKTGLEDESKRVQ